MGIGIASRPQVDVATRLFQQAVGDQHTLVGDAAIARYRSCTIPISRSIAAVLRPGSVEEIRQILQIANLHGVPLYPISTGHNWGYGSAQPVQEQNVIVDLGRLNRIIEVHEELAYAVIEPGVTQRQLYDYLQQRRIALWLNPTGAGPSCSILGNTLERGFSIGPNGDHFQSQCGMEVLLASGELLQTGFGHYASARATHVYKWGVGPYLDGLFTQSNFGIVTKIGVWLMPAPEHFEACYFTCNAEEQLGELIDAVRSLLFAGVFHGPINMLHRNRLLIMLSRYPWDEMKGQTPLAESVALRLAGEKKIGAWNGVGALCGSKEQVRASKRTIQRLLAGKVDRITFLSDRKLQMLARYPAAFSVLLKMNVAEMLGTLKESYGMLKGIPSEVALSLAYWRNRRAPSIAGELNPASDGCGIIWFAPVIPITRNDVFAFRQIIEPILSKYGFDTCMTLTALNQRCFDCTLPILFDRDDPAEVAKAAACYSELAQKCKEQGFIPYRLGVHSMTAEMSGNDVFWDVAHRLKGALDPKGILSPGRYVR